MAIQFRNNKILFVGGKIAFDPACCCLPCCPDPPEEMLFSPSDHYADAVVEGGFDSLVDSPGGGGHDGICEELFTLKPFTVSSAGATTPTTPCAEINNWAAGLPGAATGYWALSIDPWGEFWVNHFAGIPPSIPPEDFGCTDLEGEEVVLILQLALRSIPNVETGDPECWYFAQIGWYTDNTTPQVCRYYHFAGDRALTETETCLALNTPYTMYLDPTKSTETVPDTSEDQCWGCTVHYDSPTTVPTVTIDNI